ncbi:MAG TPA: type VII secretion protein EccB [Pseudonocardia sp.]|nr:type VII secretion protein EccB [Pseudonocardia sp.]
MAKQPVTRMQLDAYRFGQRRMESALARRDPVLLHEEIRGQRRVVVCGVALAMLGLVAAFAYAKFVPRPAWQAQEVVAGKQSGRLFAVIHQPDRLVPVANLAAARLVLYAAQRARGQGGGSSATATPVTVDDQALDAAPRTASAAVPGAAAILPSGDDSALASTGPWALCDSVTPGTGPTSTLIAGAGPSRPLGGTGGLLLKGPDGQRYLVVGGRKYRIQAPEVLRAYDLRDHEPRPAAAALLGVIPDGQPLDTLAPSGAGQDSAVLPGHVVGDVVRVVVAGAPDRDYLVLANGVQEIAAPVAGLIRAGLRADPSQPPDSVRLEQINALPRVTVPQLDAYPTVLPKIVDGAGSVCWQWGANGLGGTVTTAEAPPLPAGRTATPLAQADGAGPRLDAVSLPASGALVACAVSDAQRGCAVPQAGASGQQSSGALWLVSETGVGYPIANPETAGALGVRSVLPAPADALRALPAGPTLDIAEAQRTVDVLVAAPTG